MSIITKAVAAALLVATASSFAPPAGAADLGVVRHHARSHAYHVGTYPPVYYGPAYTLGPAYGYAPGYNGYEYVPVYDYGWASRFYGPYWVGYAGGRHW